MTKPYEHEHKYIETWYYDPAVGDHYQRWGEICEDWECGVTKGKRNRMRRWRPTNMDHQHQYEIVKIIPISEQLIEKHLRCSCGNGYKSTIYENDGEEMRGTLLLPANASPPSPKFTRIGVSIHDTRT